MMKGVIEGTGSVEDCVLWVLSWSNCACVRLRTLLNCCVIEELG